MRVVMLGYQTWGHKTLQALLDSHHSVELVVTHPPSEHSYENIWNDSVAELATQHGIAIHIAKKPDQAMIDAIASAQPDILVANNWRTLLPKEVYDHPPHGTLNIHDSLLPKFCGFSPIVWAMIAGESHIGLTAHYMDDSLDTGDVVAQKAIPIGPHDTSAELVKAAIDIIPEVLLEALTLIESGKANPVPQNLSQRSFFHKRSDADSAINWNWPAEDVDRFVRALSDPYPNAYCYHGNTRLHIIKAHVSRSLYGGTPGRIFIHEDNGMVIVAGAQAYLGNSRGLVIETIRLDDGSEVAAVEYFPHGGGYLTSEAA